MPHRSSFPSNSLSLSNPSIHSSSSANPSLLNSKASISSQMLHSIRGRLQGLEGLARGPQIRPRQWTAMLFTSEQTVSILQRSRCFSALPDLLKMLMCCALPVDTAPNAPHFFDSLCATTSGASVIASCHDMHLPSTIPAPWRMLSMEKVKCHFGMIAPSAKKNTPKIYTITSCMLPELHTVNHLYAPVIGSAYILAPPRGHGSMQPHLHL